MFVKENTIAAGVLRIAYREYGPAKGWPCIMGHGFPYDVRAYARAVRDARAMAIG